MEVTFSWDRDHRRLLRQPESEVCTREENMRLGALCVAIRSDDPVARDTARYEMARLAYEQRDWLQPCRAIPGPTPGYIARDDQSRIEELRDGLQKLNNCTSPRETVAASEKYPSVMLAIEFQDYVARVASVEAYNESCCKTLLMSHAWLSELNPEGDAAAIEVLRQLLRTWYRIDDPASDGTARNQQARARCRDFRWLRTPWRNVWNKI